MTSLTAKIVALHEHLREASLSHAFGGALALAFCTAEPRATKDIDVNVFIAPIRLDELVAALPEGVVVSSSNRAQLVRDGQARLWWEDTPVDVFLSNHAFHDQVEANLATVPFARLSNLPVLACLDLAVFKAFFARPKDAVDLATMAHAGTVDLSVLEDKVSALLGSLDTRRAFFERVRADTQQLD